jgi:flavorubredoxin
MKIDVIEDGLKIKYVPDEEKLDECREMGRRIGKAVNESFSK